MVALLPFSMSHDQAVAVPKSSASWKTMDWRNLRLSRNSNVNEYCYNQFCWWMLFVLRLKTHPPHVLANLTMHKLASHPKPIERLDGEIYAKADRVAESEKSQSSSSPAGKRTLRGIVFENLRNCF